MNITIITMTALMTMEVIILKKDGDCVDIDYSDERGDRNDNDLKASDK